MAPCPNCGAKLPADRGKFCSDCGAPLPPAGRGPWLVVLWICVAVVVLAGIGAGVYFLVPGLKDGGSDEAGLYPFSGRDACGYIDRTGKVVIQGENYDGSLFSEDLAAASNLDGEYGYLDKTGSWAIEPQFQNAEPFSEGLAVVQVNDTWGYIDTKGDWALAPDAGRTVAYAFSEGLGLVRYDYQMSMPGPARFTTRYAFVDKTGRALFDKQFEWAAPFSEGLAAVKEDGAEGIGYIDTAGAYVIEPRFAAAGSFSEGLAPAQSLETGAWIYVDTKGAQVIDAAGYFGVDPFSEGRAMVYLEYTGPPGSDPSTARQYGYIDTTGAEVIALQFNYAHPFSQGLAAVEMGGLWGYVDTAGALAITPQFYNATSFLPGGLARVLLDPPGANRPRSAYIDRNGKIVFQWESGA